MRGRRAARGRRGARLGAPAPAGRPRRRPSVLWPAALGLLGAAAAVGAPRRPPGGCWALAGRGSGAASRGAWPSDRRRTALAADPPCQGALRFLLARHGQTTYNAEKRFQGSLDEGPVLTEKGVAQARELGRWLGGLGPGAIGAVFTSPLLRARQTLAEARGEAGDLPAEVSFPELREIDLHEWQGRTQAEIRESAPELMRTWKERTWELRLGGGRPVVQDLWDRAAAAWALMRQRAAPLAGRAPALVVAHGTLGKALLSTALGLPVRAFRHFSLANGEVVEVAWPSAAGGPGAVWRRRYPAEGEWRSLEDEQTSLASGGDGGGTDAGAV